MTITPRKVRIVFGPILTQAVDKSLVPPSAAQIYLSDKTTVATIYSDDSGAALSNSPSIPTGVTAGAAGMDAYGNILIFGDPGVDYTCLVNSVFMPIPTTGINGTDFTDHVGVTGDISDPHGTLAAAQQYADENFLSIDTNITQVVNDTALAYLNANIGID